MPKASVVIVNFNQGHFLRRCLSSVTRTCYPDFEVLLVDNGSTDGSVEMVRANFPGVRIVENGRNLGYAGANNVGFACATGDYIAVLNPDTEVDPLWLSELVKAVEKDALAGLATPKILFMNERSRVNACGNEVTFTGITCCRGYGRVESQYQECVRVSAVSGAAFVITRAALERLTGFDEGLFLYFEDTELSLRAAIAGYKCLFVPTSVVWHDYSFKFTPRKCYLLERNRLTTLARIFEWKTLALLSPALLLGELISWSYVVLRGPAYMRAKLRASLEVVKTFRAILSGRRKTQSLRRVADHELLSTLTHRLAVDQTVPAPFSTFLAAVLHPLIYLTSRPAVWLLGKSRNVSSKQKIR